MFAYKKVNDLLHFDFESTERMGGERLPLDFSLFALARTRACQAVFVFSLHSFTRMPQVVVAQRVRCEGFSFFRFTAAIDGVHGG